MSLGAGLDTEIAGVLLEDPRSPWSRSDGEAGADLGLRQAPVRQRVSFDTLENAANGRVVVGSEVQAADALEERLARPFFELPPQRIGPASSSGT